MAYYRNQRARNPRRRWLRGIALTLLSVSLLLIVIWVLGELSCRPCDRQGLVELHGRLLHVHETPLEAPEHHQILQVILEGQGALRVIGHLKIPTDGEGPYPALLLLGGAGTGRRTLDYIPMTRGIALLALDYPYGGKTSGLSPIEFLLALPEIHRALIRTVPASMLAIDYLLGRTDIDPDRIALVGGSLGALLAPAVGAAESRLAAVVLLFGGGDIQSLLEANLRDDLGPWTRPAAWLGKLLTCALEPLDHIGAIAPRPVLMINGDEDLGIPAHNTTLLFEAAGEPKTLRWIEAGHVNIRDPRFHQLVSRELLDWFIEQGFAVPDSVLADAEGEISPPPR